MKLVLRRVGNSIGVIIPRAVLEGWGLDEGDHLEVSAQGISPPAARLMAPIKPPFIWD